MAPGGPAKKGRQTLFLFLSGILVLAFCPSGLAQTPDVQTIIQRSVQANDRDWAAAPQFAYVEKDLDPNGGTKSYEVTTVLGTPYQRLIAINGKPLSSAQRAEQQRKYDQMLSQRKAESADRRAQRIAKFKADRQSDHQMLSQLTKAFNFKLEREDKLGSHEVYVLKATPRAGYRPPNRDTEVLPAMQGELWIDKASYQWVKVEAHVTRPVSIEGFLAQVQPGTCFELEKAPVEGDIWLPMHYAMKASAKVFFLVPHHSQEDDTYMNYHRQTTSSAENEGMTPGKSDGHNP